MRTVHIQPLTHEAFAPFGQFYPMEQPQGYALCGELHRFFPDRISADSQHRVGFSPIASAIAPINVRSSVSIIPPSKKIYLPADNAILHPPVPP